MIPNLVLHGGHHSSITFSSDPTWRPSSSPTAIDPSILKLVKAAAWALHPNQRKDNFEVFTSTEFVDANWQIHSTVVMRDPYTILWTGKLIVGSDTRLTDARGLSQKRPKDTPGRIDWMLLADARIKILYATLAALELKVSERMNRVASMEHEGGGGPQASGPNRSTETLPLYEELV